MKPRERVLKPTGMKQFDSSQYDQKTLPDFRTGGTIESKSQFMLSSRYDDGYRAMFHKTFPLRNSVPYIPPIDTLNDFPGFNLFDTRKAQIEFALGNSKKDPADVTVYQPLEHRKDKAIKLGEKIYLLRAERAEDDMKKWITDPIQLQDKYFLKDRRMHDLKEHRKDKYKNGIANQNPFESTFKLMEILKDIQNQQTGNTLATAHNIAIPPGVKFMGKAPKAKKPKVAGLDKFSPIKTVGPNFS